MALSSQSVAQDAFAEILQSSQAQLTQRELQSFQSANVRDVEALVENIQARREAQREMMDMTRLGVFLDKIGQLSDTLSLFTNASDHLAIVCWGPMLFLLRTADMHKDALDKVLEAYYDIGADMPAFHAHRDFFERFPAAQELLKLVLKDLQDFHFRAIRCLDHPNTRQLFRSTWNDSARHFSGIFRSLRQQKQCIESTPEPLDPPSTDTQQPITLLSVDKLVFGNNYDRVDLSGGQAVLGNVYEGDVDKLAQLLDNLKLSLDEAKESLVSQETARQRNQAFHLAEWIAAVPASRYQDEAYAVHQEYHGTGSWILRNDKVTSWMHEDLPRKSTLWMHGIPGAGKTVLASIIINACTHLPDADTMYFYCKHDDDKTTTALSVLKGFLTQSMDCRPRFKPYFDEKRSRSGEAVLCTENTAKKLFNIVSRAGKRLYMIIDGLDECRREERKSILKYLDDLLREVGQEEPGNLRLLVVSQKELDIGGALSDMDQLELHSSHNQDDINVFVKQQAEKIKSKFSLTDEQEDILKKQVCWRASGQFLYARLMMDHLLSQMTPRQLQDELQAQHFPEDLIAVYERILHRIKSHNTLHEWKMARRLLGWMVCAARPLKWHEIQGAVCIDTENDEVNFGDLKLCRRLDDVCGALVSVHKDRISLVHSTARDFIAGSELIDVHEAGCELLTICLHYLSFPCFDPETEDEEFDRHLNTGYFAFADYAVAKWVHHLIQFIDSARALMDPARLQERIIMIQKLCEVVETFGQEYEEDLRAVFKSDVAGEPCTALNRDIMQLLDTCNTFEAAEYDEEEEGFETSEEVGTFGEAKGHFAQLFGYTQRQKRSSGSRHDITLPRLKKAMERFRTALEGVVKVDNNLDRKLVEYYGDRPFKCSDPTCFYFHEGFKTKKIRDKHRTRHERPWLCDEPECRSGDFGFMSKTDLEKHQTDFHPDIEMKMRKFAEAKPKVAANRKWPCPICGKRFVRNNILKDHLLTHSGQKPHECPKCGKPFTRKSDCVRHEQTHENR